MFHPTPTFSPVAQPMRPKVLNHRASKIAEQLYFLFQNAYRYEARLIGGPAMGYFAPLQRQAADIRLAPTRIIGLETATGEIIAAIELMEPVTDQPWCLIDGLCVNPNHFRSGNASTLVRAVIAAYRKKAVPLRVKTALANKPAMSLFEGVGFTTIATETFHELTFATLELPL